MINSQLLLTTLKGQLTHLLADLHRQVDTVSAIGDELRSEYQRAFDAERTGWSFTEWADDRLTQVAVGWLLGCVFVRYGEDNGLIDDHMIGGSGNAAALARAAQQDHFRANPTDSDREYLHHVFRKAAALPGLDGVLGESRSPLWLTDPSGDACTELLELFRRTDDDGELVLDFTDPVGNTRFLGDLYQDLSEHAKKTYALLQTPDFVEEFILDRTLDPAIESVGLAQVSIIDPTCGSGHFLLGAFERLWQRWTDAEPAMPSDQRAAKALDAVWGVDINPFAAAIARFRLLVAAMQRADQKRLADVRDYPIHVAVGDSLLWGSPKQSFAGMEGIGGVDHQFLYPIEDAEALRRTYNRRYTVVVGNPPYIIPNDKAANAAYRQRYTACHRKYQLGAPFTELFFQLAEEGSDDGLDRAGYVGLINSNAFMKREFGRPLVEEILSRIDLSMIVDTSGAHIPGHGTATAIIFGRNRLPVGDTVTAILGNEGEPGIPQVPSKGEVWSAILAQIENPGILNPYVSVAQLQRTQLAVHPWSIGGGGASELKAAMDSRVPARLGTLVVVGGFGAIPGLDDVYVSEARGVFSRKGVEPDNIASLVIGDKVRDWSIGPAPDSLFPYAGDGESLEKLPPGLYKHMWPFVGTLDAGLYFGKTNEERGQPWWEFAIFFPDRYRAIPKITWAFVATHNHFVLSFDPILFKQSAPIMILSADVSVRKRLAIVAALNSSCAEFWLRQVLQPKDRSPEAWSTRFERDNTKLQQFPLPHEESTAQYGAKLAELAGELKRLQPSEIVAVGLPDRERLDAARLGYEHIFGMMVALQEELDWLCLYLYGIAQESDLICDIQDLPPLGLGERAFEIVLARRMAAGETSTAWFDRHASRPLTDLCAHWPDWYRDLVNRRIQLIETDRNIGLVERPEHKRRWVRTPWADLEQAALRDWLLDRLEDTALWLDGEYAVTRTIAQLADQLSMDEDGMSVARLYSGQVDVDPLAMVTGLIADQHVPAQAAARYKSSGRKKRVEWERTWERQRAEDRGELVDRIAVPPKYAEADFVRPAYWKHRGKLDVPKERFTSVIGAERDASSGDSTMVLAWAGFDHAQLAQSLATLLYQRQTVDGWGGEQLLPLVAALDEVLPWVEQWHPDVDPGLGQPLAAFYRGQLDQVLTSIGATIDDARAWEPPAPARGRKAGAKKKAEA